MLAAAFAVPATAQSVTTVITHGYSLDGSKGAWIEGMADAIVARLAAELAYPIASSTSLAQSMWQLYEMKLREARGVDAQEGTPPEAVMADLWMRARL